MNALKLYACALLAFGLSTGAATADVLKFSWNAVDDARVAQYVLAWGTVSKGAYGKGSVAVQAPATVAVTPDLAAGTWYFAVKACTAGMSLCSGWSNEVVVHSLGPIPVPGALTLDGVTFIQAQ